MADLAWNFPDQERYRVTPDEEVCGYCDHKPLLLKSIPNGELAICPHCHREAEVRSFTKLH